jgi:hypothetical protein
MFNKVNFIVVTVNSEPGTLNLSNTAINTRIVIAYVTFWNGNISSQTACGLGA